MCDLRTEMQLRLAALRETFPDHDFMITAYPTDGCQVAVGGKPATPNFCESCAGPVDTCDCVNPQPVGVDYAPRETKPAPAGDA